MNPAAPAGRRPWSMTARLVTLQVLAMAAVLGAVMAVLYFTIAAHLETDNQAEFANEMKLLSRWLSEDESSPPDSTARQEHAKLLSTLPVLLRIIDSDGQVRFENRSPFPIPLTAFPLAGESSVGWRAPDHQRFLLASELLRGPAGRTRPILQAAYDVSDDDTLLRHLRQRTGIVFAFAIVLSGALATMIARGVFRPLAQLAARAASVHASHLNTQIGEAGWPTELTTLVREFNAMLARLDDSFRRLSRFSSDLSHELRTPINNLRGEAEVALSRPRPIEEYRAVLESNLEECARLGRLIDTLLFIAKADHPSESIPRTALDAAAECRAVAEFFEPMASERGLTLLVRGAGQVHGNAELLRRALANLVDNAARHTAAGGHIDLTVRTRAAAGTEIEIADNGAGIPAEALPHVFERFYRSEKSAGQHHSTTGFGLGLAIVKSIMDLHGGTVTVSSEPQRGTSVLLFFPGPNAAGS